MAKTSGLDAELEALGTVFGALERLDEEQQSFVLRTAIDRLGLGAVNLPNSHASTRSSLPPSGGAEGLSKKTPKAFMREKNPNADVQRITCLAFFLTHARDTANFKTKDLTDLNTEAAGRKFSNATVAVNNASLSGLVTAAGGGKKQITALGEDIVDALPDQEKVKTIVAAGKKPRKRRQSAKKK